MVTQVGLFQRAEAQGTPERAGAFLESLEAHFDRPFAIETSGPAIMGMQSSEGTALNGCQPFATTRLCVTCDGRIDDPVTPIASPGGFIASAYEQYGINWCARMEGDYAIACYDTNARALHLARDPFGTRPLYYYLTSDVVIWSSDLAYLAALLGPAVEIDDYYVADYLTGFQCRDRTPYKAIRSIEPGTVLSITGEGQDLHKFWDLQWHGQIVYKRDADYEAHFRCLFTQSVERRLRGGSIALADLSGGLDSPSVVCIADDLIKAGRSNCGALETLSYHYAGFPMTDESRLVAVVEERRGKRSHPIAQKFFSFDPTLNLSKPDVSLVTADAAHQIHRARLSSGADVLLCGLGGDEVQHARSAMGQDIADLFRACQPIECYRSAARWATAERTTVAEVMRHGLRVQRLSRKRRIPALEGSESMLASLDRSFVERFSCRDRLNVPEQFNEVASLSLRYQYSAIVAASWYPSQCSQRELTGCDMTYPFLDRALVSFMLGIPTEQKARPGQNKSLVRRALAGVLPQPLLAKKHKVGGPDQAFLGGLRQNWPELQDKLRQAEIFQRGYADREAFTAHLTRAKHGLITASLLSFWRLFALEEWLQLRRRNPAKFSKLHSCLLDGWPVDLQKGTQ